MWRCNVEDCEGYHCQECGRHYDPACSGNMPRVCDACQIEWAANETETITKGFGGNYEEAARFMGW